MKRKNGFSILEVLVALIIMGLSLLGMFSVFIAGRRYTERSRRKLTSINVGRKVLETLKDEVRQDTWSDSSNKLRVGNGLTINSSDLPEKFLTYWDGTVIYDVSAVPDTNLRQASITIRWNEPSE
ncbi:MAG: type II secretion system protein [Candidatus Gygaella obscura]|nr:type II secretion system protein [Candidatus Gygaella obscura]